MKLMILKFNLYILTISCNGCYVNFILNSLAEKPATTSRPPIIVDTSRPPVVADEEESCDDHDCGENAYCLEENGIPVCKCTPGYFGNPSFGCRPECVIDQDCSSSKACYGGKCLDPCPGICGSNAECYVTNHKPVCACKPSYTGDPYTGCYYQQRKGISIFYVINDAIIKYWDISR